MNDATERIEEARPRRFRRYPEYKDSGVSWLGDIPAYWEVYPLRRRLFRKAGSIRIGPFGSALKLEFMVNEGFKVYSQEHVIAKDFSRGSKYVGTAKFTELAAYEIWPRDLVITMMGSSGRCAVVPDGIDTGIMDSHLLRIRLPDAELDPSFLALLIDQADYISHQVRAAGKGAIMHGLNSSIIKSIFIAVPPSAEQLRILGFIGSETARIDRLVDRKERLIELLQQKRAALITRAVTRGLDPNAPMKDFGVEWLGEIPAHWEVKRLRHIVRHIEQGWSPDCENREAGADEWGVLKAGCVNRGRFLESEHKALPSTLSPIPALEIRKGDLLMSRASGSRDLVGSVAVVSECRPHLLLCDKVFRLHTESSAGHRQFIGYAMNSRIVRWQIESVISGGSGLASNISQEAVKDLVVVQPPRSERWEIAGYLDCETAKIDALIAKVRQAIDHLKEFRTALISAAVTGKIDVREEAS